MKTNKRVHVLSLLPLIVFRLFAPPKKVGGQAIIEGVMMRGKQNVSWAVRKTDGSMVVEKMQFVSVGKKNKALRLPVLRGAVGLYESLVLGYKALSRSAEIAMEEERAARPETTDPKKQKLGDRLTAMASFAIAMVISIGLFMYGPMWLVSQFIPKESALLFNAVAGSIRILLFLLYLILISQWSEMRRIFEYHGAEHKAIFTYEDGKELTLDNMRPYTTFHPRCGTSFLLLTGIVCILLFSIVDALFISFVGPYPSVVVRLLVHLVLVPLIAGCSFEVLKLSDRYKRVPLVGALILPGLWLQKITTKPPDDRQLEVASAALKAVL